MALWQRGKSYYYDFWYHGQRFVGSIGPVSKTTAKKRYARLWADAAEGILGVKVKAGDPFFEDLAARYLEAQRPLWRPRTYTVVESVVRVLCRYFGTTRVSHINRAMVEDFKAERAKLGLKPSTQVKDLSTLQAVFHWGMQRGEISKNPVAEVSFPEDPQRRIRFLTDMEEKRLLLACSPTLGPLVKVALHTSLRKKELLGLRWTDIDFERRILTVREDSAKSGVARDIPLNRDVWEVLTGLQAANPDSEQVFLNRLGRPYVQISTLYRAAVKRAGIVNFRFHDLRHTFASRLVIRGASLATVRELLGHQDYAMTLRYAHLADETKRLAVEILEQSQQSSQQGGFYPRLDSRQTGRSG